jgi:hypothetical protein
MGLVFEVKMGTEGSNDRKPTVTLGKLCCKCFLRAKMGADVVWWKTQMVDFGQWVSYVQYGHNAKHTFFWGGRTKFGRIDPNFLGYFIFSHHSYCWLLEFKTKH